MNAAFDRIELRSGAAPWLRRLQSLLPLAAAIVLAGSGAAPNWILAALGALVVAWVVSALSSRSSQADGRLRFGSDGVLTLVREGRERTVAWDGHAWNGRHLSVIHWRSEERPRRGRVLVCASANDADAYRRLRVVLRLGGVQSP